MKHAYLILFFACVTELTNAQLSSTPYAVWNDPSAPPQLNLNIRNGMSTSNTVIDQLGSSGELVASSYTPNVGGYNWYTVDIPGTTSALSGYCAAWYLSPNYYAIPECGSQIVTVGSSNLFIRPSAGNVSQNVTISGTAAKVFVGQRFVLSQQTTVGNDVWYKIYLTNNCSQTQGWVAGYYQGTTYSTLSSQSVNPLPSPTLNQPTGGDITSSSIYLSWSQVPGATSYIVTYNGNTQSTTNTNVTLSPLTSNTQYSITVKAVYGSCTSPGSNSVNATTSSSCTPPTSPTSASATQTTITSGQQTTLQVNGGSLNSAANWVWYTGSCGGTQVGTGATLPVSPTTTTTYYVSASACSTTTTCRSVTITVTSCTAPTSPTGASATQTTITSGQQTTLQVNGGSLNSASNWVWYTGSCGGTQVGTGATLPVSPTATTTYYVDATACSTTTTCRSVTITVTGTSNPIVTVTYPNGGETWTIGSSTPQPITATITGQIQGKQIELSLDGGQTWNFIYGISQTSQTLSVPWNVNLGPSQQCKIRVSVIPAGGGAMVSDVSNANFTIVNPGQFNLNPVLSHLRWPFPPPTTWNNRGDFYGSQADPFRNPLDGTGGGYGNGSNAQAGGHHQCDYFADDWNKTTYPDECNLDFRAPLAGTIIWANHDCVNTCTNMACLKTNACGLPTHHNPSGYGNQVVIRSAHNPNYCFRVSHLNNVYVTVGNTVDEGTVLGTIGSTGAAQGAHAHCVLYKDVLNPANFHPPFPSTGLSELSCGFLLANDPYVSGLNGFACNFVFDAVTGGDLSSVGGGSNDVTLIYPPTQTTLCLNDTIILSATHGNHIYWSTGDTTPTIKVSTPGHYSIVYVDSSGNFYSDEIYINAFNAPSVTILPVGSITICSGNSVILSASDADSYLWSTTATTSDISVNSPGTYSVTITNSGICSATATASVIVSGSSNPVQPTIQLSGTVLAASTIQGCTYLWYLNGSLVGVGQFIGTDTIGTGFYTVAAVNSSGCSTLSDPFIVSGIEETGISEMLKIYPNPNTGMFTLLLKSEGERQVEIECLNFLGEKIYAKQHELINGELKTELNLLSVVKGLYFTRITINGKSIYRKVIITE